MEKIKKTIIVLGIVIFTIIIILIVVILNRKDQIDNESILTKSEDTSINGGNQEIFSNQMEEVTNAVDYCAVKDAIDKFYTNTGYLNANIEDLRIVVTDSINTEEVLEEYKEEGIKAISKMLDKSYIEEFNVDNYKIYNDFKEYSGDSLYIKEMYSMKVSSNTNFFIVYGMMKETKKEVKFIVKIDTENINFSIFPEEFLEKYNYNKDSTDIVINTDSIEENDYNIAKYTNIDDVTLAKYYLEDYKERILINTEMAYNVLDDEYKNKRFGSLENYKKYIEENKEIISNVTLSKYKVKEYDGYTEYVCIDNYGNYYIFKETAVMDYTAIADAYTIDIPEVTEKYNNSTNKEKVGININKIFSAINTKDYAYVYNKLDETFKNNNYRTQEDLENYIKTILYDQNTVEFEQFEERSGTYMYKIKVKNTEDESQTTGMTVIMQLKEGTDFVMSFSIE